MLKIFYIFCIVLIYSNLLGQNSLAPKMKIIWNSKKNLFYETPDLRKIDFQFENLSSEKMDILRGFKSESVQKVKFSEDKNSICSGSVYFKKSITIDDIRKNFDQMDIIEFYVNDKKVLTRTLISESDAKSLAMDFVFKDMPFKKEFNDSSRIEYYDFQIYYAGTKLQYMWGKSYPKYLYDGYVAKYTELLETSKIRRENFLKTSNK